MLDVRTIVHARPTGQRGMQNVSGYVSYQQPLAGSWDGPYYVVIPSHSTEISWPIWQWPAEHGGTLPTWGTPVLCAWDERNVLHLVRWYANYTPPPLAVEAEHLVGP